VAPECDKTSYVRNPYFRADITVAGTASDSHGIPFSPGKAESPNPEPKRGKGNKSFEVAAGKISVLSGK